MGLLTVEELIMLKKCFGFTNEMLSEKSGVPLSTVQKVFSGCTESPRRSTLQALSDVFAVDGGIDSAEGGIRTDELREENHYGSRSAKSVVPSPGTSAENMVGKTIDDYIALPEGTRIELIDGVFYDMAAPNFAHQRIGAMIFNKLENYVNENDGPCIPSVAPTDVRLDCDDKTMVQPDVLVVCDRDKITKLRVEGAPDLIVEVLSSSNWYTDMVIKLRKYRNAGVREYWIVIPDQEKILVYEFEKSSDSVEYTFEDKVPVGIWDGKCEVDFKYIYDKISFLL